VASVGIAETMSDSLADFAWTMIVENLDVSRELVADIGGLIVEALPQ